MKLAEKETCFFIENVFPGNILAGFSKPNLQSDSRNGLSLLLRPFVKQPQIASLRQIHSSKIHHINKPGEYIGDGITTQENGIICSVRTADCMPVIFYSCDFDVIGVIHMGWKGAKEGILDNIKYDLGSFKVIAGVGMRKCCYEVGSEFFEYKEFKKNITEDNNKLYFDPIQFIKDKLFPRGLREENFFDLGICSFCSKEGFFSFRRNKTEERTISFIIKENNCKY